MAIDGDGGVELLLGRMEQGQAIHERGRCVARDARSLHNKPPNDRTADTHRMPWRVHATMVVSVPSSVTVASGEVSVR